MADDTAAAMRALTGVDETEAPADHVITAPIAARRAAKTLAQRLRRAAAKAAVQWKGDHCLTAAAE